MFYVEYTGKFYKACNAQLESFFNLFMWVEKLG